MYEEFYSMLQGVQNVAVIAHFRPDGDAITSNAPCGSAGTSTVLLHGFCIFGSARSHSCFPFTRKSNCTLRPRVCTHKSVACNWEKAA